MTRVFGAHESLSDLKLDVVPLLPLFRCSVVPPCHTSGMRIRTRVIQIRATEQEFDDFTRAAGDAGFSAYARAALVEARLDRAEYFRAAIAAMLAKPRVKGVPVDWRRELEDIRDAAPMSLSDQERANRDAREHVEMLRRSK